MSIQFGSYIFKGPFSSTRELQNRPGVFILQQKSSRDIVQVEQCLQLKNNLEDILVQNEIDLHPESEFEVFVYYSFCLQLSEREAMVRELKEQFCQSGKVM